MIRGGAVASEFEPEVGQLVFGNTPWHERELPSYVEEGISILASLCEETGLTDGYLAANFGAKPVSTTVFTMRTYCWCDGDEHPNGCPPNFVIPSAHFIVTWYKHVGRGASMNREMSADEWAELMIECLDSVLTAPSRARTVRREKPPPKPQAVTPNPSNVQKRGGYPWGSTGERVGRPSPKGSRWD